MMQGIIENGRHPRLRVMLASPTTTIDFKALFDSGFDGEVALPYFVADQLRLEIVRFAEVTYANGQKIEEIVCEGEIFWHEERRPVEIVLSEDDQPAIGTSLLQGCWVMMDFIYNTFNIDRPT